MRASFFAVAAAVAASVLASLSHAAALVPFDSSPLDGGSNVSITSKMSRNLLGRRLCGGDYYACGENCGGGCCPRGYTCTQNNCCYGSGCGGQCTGLSTGNIITIVLLCTLIPAALVSYYFIRRRRMAQLNAMAPVAQPPPTAEMIILPGTNSYARPGTLVYYSTPGQPQVQMQQQVPQQHGQTQQQPSYGQQQPTYAAPPAPGSYPPETDAAPTKPAKVVPPI